jgi:1-pyrroline-5-carboxylate dehydrogenase
MIEILENLPHHLTAAIVSNDVLFTERMLSSSINGTTYHGLKARTTGAP